MRGIYHEGFTMREVSPEVFHHGSHHFRADRFQYSYFFINVYRSKNHKWICPSQEKNITYIIHCICVLPVGTPLKLEDSGKVVIVMKQTHNTPAPREYKLKKHKVKDSQSKTSLKVKNSQGKNLSKVKPRLVPTLKVRISQGKCSMKNPSLQYTCAKRTFSEIFKPVYSLNPLTVLFSFPYPWVR